MERSTVQSCLAAPAIPLIDLEPLEITTLIPFVCHKSSPQNQVSHGWKSAAPSRGSRQVSARIDVPERLRPILKKVELSAAPGADRRAALRKLPVVTARFQEQIAEAERQCTPAVGNSGLALALDAVKAARAPCENSLASDSDCEIQRPSTRILATQMKIISRIKASCQLTAAYLSFKEFYPANA